MQDQMLVNGLSYQVVTGNNKAFWDKMKVGTWETETFDFFRNNITPNSLVLDVGSWIGPTALYAAQFADRCIAFEPDPVAFEELKANYQANHLAEWASRLTVVNAAVTSDGQPLILGSRTGGGDSTSSALFADSESHWTVPSRKLDDILRESASPEQPVFIKIDIEGGEYSLLPTVKHILSRPKASFHISLHPRFLRRSLRAKYSRLPQPLRFIKVRLEFIRAHMRILASLPDNKDVRFISSTPAWALPLMAMFMGRFPKDIRIVAGNNADKIGERHA